jgi:oxazoline/thiazoline synthase
VTGRPVFGPAYRVEVIPTEGVYLLSERGRAVLKGRLPCLVAPLLDGKHLVDDIVDELTAEVSPAEVYYALAQMEKRGYLVDADEDPCSPASAIWSALGVSTVQAAERLASHPVEVVSLGGVGVADVSRALTSSGARVGEPARFVVAVTDDYLQEGLDHLNQRALEIDRPWLLAKTTGTVVWIGPVFWPGRTACWACLAHRLRANRELENYLEARTGRQLLPPAPLAHLPSTEQVGIGLVAFEVLRAIVSQGPPRDTAMMTFDLVTGASQTHEVIRRPQCPRCGDASYQAARPPAPVRIEGGDKTPLRDGGHRSVAPELTVRRFERHVSPISGAVTTLQPIDTGRRALHVYTAGHTFSSVRGNVASLRRAPRGGSSGKGMSDEQARASGLCEALERYSGIYQGYEPRRRARLSELGDEAIHPNDCMNFSDRQYARREAWNEQSAGYQIVPKPFDPEVDLEWSPVWSLTSETFRYLPTGYLYYGYKAPPEAFFFPDSNGNAAGNTLEEAVLQGFMELVERDSVCIWWYNRLRQPGVALDSFGEPYFDRVQTIYEELSRDLWVLDVTSDLGVPSFAAISRRVDKPAEDILMGFGAHFDPGVAIGRAISEVNQFLPAVLQMRSDGSGDYGFEEQQREDWSRTATIAEHDYLRPSVDASLRRRSDYTDHSTADLGDDVRACQRLVESREMEMLVLDQTRPDIGLNVVKVIVPGLRHFWARFGPGRLYTVPVAMGRLRDPIPEDALNPVSMFL